MLTRTSFISAALLAVAAAAPSHLPLSLRQRQVSNASESEWDYIVAGAGPAGIIVAERLAEKGSKVLLLERGGPSTQSSGGTFNATWDADGLTVYDIPSQSPAIFETGAISACDDTAGLAGCLLGGGVEVNALVFVEPPNHDFDDNWPEGWKYSDVENAANSLYSRNPPTTTPSTDGLPYDTREFQLLGSFLNSTLGYSQIDAVKDRNSKEKVYSRPSFNIQNGERGGPVRSYLPLAQNLTNFSLQMHSSVIRVVRDGNTITGVEVNNTETNTRSIISVCSGGRVVLAAGSMRTPAILINSGIGPTDQIETVANSSSTLNITLPEKSDWISLPVGTQIKDHPIVTVNFDVPSSENLTLYDYNDPLESDKTSYLSKRTGVLAQGYQRLLFWNSFVGSDNKTRYIQGTTSASANNTIQIKFYLTHGLTSIGQLGMTSSGATTLLKAPYFTSTADSDGLATFIDSFISSVQNSTSWTQSSSTNGTGAELIKSYVAGDHYVGTAKMGKDSGLEGGESVVDCDTKVYGTENLFVVDASIHPDLPTGNTQAIVMVVAERAAEKILALGA